MLVIVGLTDGDDTAVGNLADAVFKLNCSMEDVELGRQQIFYAAKNGGTLRRGNVGDLDMAGERMRLRTEAPYMHVMDTVYTFKRANHGHNFFRGHAVRSSLQQYVEGFADDPERRPQDETTDTQRKQRVDPILACPQYGPAAHDDRRRGKRVS